MDASFQNEVNCGTHTHTHTHTHTVKEFSPMSLNPLANSPTMRLCKSGGHREYFFLDVRAAGLSNTGNIRLLMEGLCWWSSG